MDDQFYVYVILDPRTKYNISHLYFNFEYLPIYIGKGKNNRKNFHTFESRLNERNGNRLKNNTLNKIIREGYNPIIQIIKDGLSEEESFELEKSLISNIGRRCLKKGTLTNLTSGGEGQSGSISFIKEKNPFYKKSHSEETIKKLSKPINQYDMNHTLIQSYTSTTDASKKLNISSNKIRDCLKGRSKTYKLFIWEYVDKRHRYDTQHSEKTTFKYILQKDLNNNPMKKWGTISEIIKSVDIQKSNLIDCLKGRKNTSGGYKWVYIS